MSTKGEVLHHRRSGEAAQTWDGFSWPAFLIPTLWMLQHGSWPAGIGLALWQCFTAFFVFIALLFEDMFSGEIVLLAVVQVVARLISGFTGNATHKTRLRSRGFSRKPHVSGRQHMRGPSLFPPKPPATADIEREPLE